MALGELVILAAPLAVEPQQATKVPRVGFLSANSPFDPQFKPYLDAIRQGLREVGYVEGQSIAIEYRWAEGKYQWLPDLAAELVRLKVDVIVAAGGVPVAQAARQATQAIPIIIVGPADPVAAGLVSSLSRPGGNITGLATITDELVGKELDLLRELAPKVSRVAVLWNPANPGNAPQLRKAELAARALEVRLRPLEAEDPGAIDLAFTAMTKERVGALLVLGDTMFITQRERIADLAAKSRLPAVYGNRLHAEAGGLMAYGANLLDMSRRVASYVDKVLKGAKPADLPVEQPTKFELVINLKTAKALGLTIPRSLLLRADEVIQ